GAGGLVSADEVDEQLSMGSGPVVELPDVRVHEVFQERVVEHPDRVAAVHAGVRWTYGELNARANRLARALRARGLRDEDVVAVVTHRDLSWLASVWAVFKAGGVYLPVEPHFPAERIAATLARSGCRLVLTEPDAATHLEQALHTLPTLDSFHGPLPEVVQIDDALGEDHPDNNLDLPVTADQAAYVYFTSGSTGEPKGAMCEHAGMLNHLLAKIEDLHIGDQHPVVAQTAPQCFDISLWQLIAAQLVGGRTVLVEQDAVLDVPRLITTLEDNQVAVWQVVPSYLEVVLSYLEDHPHALADLAVVSVTGEALKKELTQRWFTTRPHVPLVNAYGLTETCDDTNHHVMHTTPRGDRVPLGRPVRNV
ncbi:AMP-binding protein, partial [Streptomyces sp. NPDC059176]